MVAKEQARAVENSDDTYILQIKAVSTCVKDMSSLVFNLAMVFTPWYLHHGIYIIIYTYVCDLLIFLVIITVHQFFNLFTMRTTHTMICLELINYYQKERNTF